jgi:hypothetical protein
MLVPFGKCLSNRISWKLVQAGKDFMFITLNEEFNPQMLWQFILIQLTELLIYGYLFCCTALFILLKQNYVYLN